ncbi:serine hydrolase [Streptomyces avermitilis]|uniref:serine hydrolase n=1 Tax=Streptomyces avermitilis TaxID=33903 RepID=UPI0033DEC910
MTWFNSYYPALRVGWDLTEGEYKSAFDMFMDGGYRIVDLCGYEVGGQARYAAIWEIAHPSGRDTQTSNHRIPFADFSGWVDRFKIDGYRPVRVNGYSVAGQTFFATIWEQDKTLPLWQEYHEVKLGDLYTHVSDLRGQGYDLVDLSAYTSPGLTETLCATVWEGWPGYNTSWSWIQPQWATNYQDPSDREGKADYRPTRTIGFTTHRPGSSDAVMYTSVSPRSEGYRFHACHGLEAAELQDEVKRKKLEGFRLVSLGGFSAGYAKRAVQAFCPIWERREATPVIDSLVAKFMQYHEVPGLSLAIAKGGLLVASRGFGLADKDAGEKVNTDSLFRIASISKTITAAACTKLFSEGAIAPQDRVFGNNSHFEELGTPSDPRVDKIIVQNLLEHSSGGWRNDINDPMDTHPNFNHRELIKWVLANRTLEYSPGTKYLYSNFGYFLLGRLIEKVTDKPYDAYVKENILTPCGITDMNLAAISQRPGEVVYYDQDGRDPYGLPMTRKDSEGGWLGTATDLLRFAVRVDGFPTTPDILDPGWNTYMTRPSGLYDDSKPEPKPGLYANGWHVDGSTWWGSGDLPGTTSILVRTQDGFCWAAVINTRRKEPEDKKPKDKDTRVGLDYLMWAIHDQVDNWPPGQEL